MIFSPDFERTTRLVSRALGISAAELLAGFRPAGQHDIAAVIAFRRTQFGNDKPSTDADYLQWRYRFGNSDRGLGDLWILHLNERLVGIIGTEDVVCLLNGIRHTGIRTMDILIEHSLRSSGLGVWLNQAIIRQADFTLAIGGNRNSIGTVTRLFQPLTPLFEWKQPIDLSSYLRRRVRSTMVANIVIKLANLLLRGWRRLSSLSLDRDVRIQAISRFDDNAALPLTPAKPGEAIIERSAKYLNYRLFDNPRSPYRVYGAFRSGELVGYLAWRHVTEIAGRSFVHVIDWQVIGTNMASTLRRLLDVVSREAEAENCDYVSLSQQGVSYHRLFNRAGYLAMGHRGHKIVGLQARDASILDNLASADWSLTDLTDDNDAG